MLADDHFYKFVWQFCDNLMSGIESIKLFSESLKSDIHKNIDYINKHGDELISSNAYDIVQKVETIRYLNYSYKNLPNMLYVSHIASFETLLYGHLEYMFRMYKKKLPKKSNILVEEILNYDSYDFLKDYIIEKEIIKIMSQSTKKQIEDVIKYCSLKKVKVDNFLVNEVIRASLIRNVLIHNNSRINNKIINEFKINKIHTPINFKVGEFIDITPKEYYTSVYNILTLGLQLSIAIWYKNDKKTDSLMLSLINDISYSLMIKGHINYVALITEFAINLLDNSLEKYCDKVAYITLIINFVICYKKQKKDNNFMNILNKVQWDKCDTAYKLLYYVLTEDIDNVIKKMYEIGPKSPIITKQYYQTWPVFEEIRDNVEFKKAYKKIFKQEYKLVLTDSQKKYLKKT